LGFLDVSTGEFTAQGNAEYIDKLLQNFNPSEVLIQKNKIIFGNFWDDFHSFIWRIDLQRRLCFETLTNIFKPLR
jgi:DNA mismatch repair protein MutS